MSKLEFRPANQVYSTITDGTHDSPKKVDFGKPLITSKHIKGRNINFEAAYLISQEDFDKINNRSAVKQWDVIVSMIGEYCGFCYVERNSSIDYAIKNVGVYRAGNKLESEWLYYYLVSPIGKAYLNSVKSGSSQPYLTLGGLRNLPILQKKEVQKKSIVEVLSGLDAKIELNNKINKELEAMAKLIYDYWFVQFDFPDENGKPYKYSGGKMVYNEELKRDIPEGWEVKELGELAVLKAGGDRPKDWSEVKKADFLVPIYSNGVTNDGLYGYAKTSKINKPSFTVSARGTIGFCVLRMKPYVPIVRLISITPKTSAMLKFLQERVKLINFDDSGSVQKQLTVPMIENLRVVVPKKIHLHRYADLTNTWIELIEKNKEENDVLTLLRDWLLPMLMNGQVRVGEAEEKVLKRKYGKGVKEKILK